MQRANSLSHDRSVQIFRFLGPAAGPRSPESLRGLQETRVCLLSHQPKEHPCSLLCPGNSCNSIQVSHLRDIDSKAMFFPSTCIFLLRVIKADQGCCCLGSQMKRAERKHSIYSVGGKTTWNLPSSLSCCCDNLRLATQRQWKFIWFMVLEAGKSNRASGKSFLAVSFNGGSRRRSGGCGWKWG